MPVYVYEEIESGAQFEVVQSMREAPLSTHPETGRPVRRVILPPNLGTKHTTGKEKKMLDNRNVEKAGFTKYERDKSTGTYHRVAGNKGPESFRKE
ncbi:MAG: FmdB family transcriptional regulator [Verrucomicrobia bacterium]|nr:FmdB family transcriptional regulator [Verrucomicrobiota bacterium]MCH8510678.1 FmdB family transcriptional regulator [Kiritimatiellia bacterium]